MQIRTFGTIALCLALLAGCDRQSAAPAKAQPPEVRTVAAWTGDVERVVQSVGQMRAVESVTLTAEVAGLLRAVHFQEGGAVAKGDLLVELDDGRAVAELDAARARRDRAARQMERYEQAATTSAASLTELDTVRTELQEAEAQFELARIIVEDHRITAPFSGKVGLRMVSPGGYIQAGDALATLTTVDPIDIEFSVPEIFLADLRPGQQVVATSPAYPGRPFYATIDVVTPVVDPSTRTVLILAEAPNPEGLLRPGMFVNVRVVLGKREDAVLVPEAAVQYQGTQAHLFIVEGDQARRRHVRVGERRAGVVEIVEGLSAGEQVVTAGLQKIRDGTAVRATPQQPAEAPAVSAAGGSS